MATPFDPLPGNQAVWKHWKDLTEDMVFSDKGMYFLKVRRWFLPQLLQTVSLSALFLSARDVRGSAERAYFSGDTPVQVTSWLLKP